MAKAVRRLAVKKMTTVSRTVRRTAPYWWVLLFLLFPVVWFVNPARTVVLGLMLLLPAGRMLAYRRAIPATPLNWPIALLLIMVLVSSWVTPDLTFSLPKIAGTLFGIAVYFVTVDMVRRSAETLWKTIILYILIGCGLIAVGFINIYPPLMGKVPFIGSLTVNPNEVGGIITWVLPALIPISAALLTQSTPKLSRPIAFALGASTVLLTLLLGGILAITASRSALIGCIAALVFMGGMLLRKRMGLLIGFAAVIVGSGGGGLFYLGQSRGWENLIGDGSSNAISLTGRVEVWSRAIYALGDFPLTGVGMNMFRRVVHVLYPLFSVEPGKDIAHAHNHLLQAALDLGIPGLIAYLSLWITVGFILWHSWRAAHTQWQRVLIVSLASALIAHFTFGFTDAIAIGAKPGFMLWLLFGLAIGQHHHVHRTSKPEI